MHGRVHGHLQGFQIQLPCRTEGAKGDTQQLVYFARDFLLDAHPKVAVHYNYAVKRDTLGHIWKLKWQLQLKDLKAERSG